MEIKYILLLFTIITGVLTLLGVKLLRNTVKSNREAEKYEFHNRTSGGTVQFKSFEAAKSHERNKNANGCGFQIGFLLTAFAGIGFAIFAILTFLTFFVM